MAEYCGKTGLGATPGMINLAVRGIAHLTFNGLYARAVKERTTYAY